jgi:hypothetical protein
VTAVERTSSSVEALPKERASGPPVRDARQCGGIGVMLGEPRLKRQRKDGRVCFYVASRTMNYST